MLLKGLDERGLVFFTNLQSRKGRELAENPRASAVLTWLELQRQVRVEGAVELVGAEESDAYFASRPHGSKLGALASPQSRVIESRGEMERAWAELAERYPEGTEVPRPEWWGGLRLVPDAVEFWQGHPDRLHDRLRFRPHGRGVGRGAPGAVRRCCLPTWARLAPCPSDGLLVQVALAGRRGGLVGLPAGRRGDVLSLLSLSSI